MNDFGIFLIGFTLAVVCILILDHADRKAPTMRAALILCLVPVAMIAGFMAWVWSMLPVIP